MHANSGAVRKATAAAIESPIATEHTDDAAYPNNNNNNNIGITITGIGKATASPNVHTAATADDSISNRLGLGWILVSSERKKRTANAASPVNHINNETAMEFPTFAVNAIEDCPDDAIEVTENSNSDADCPDDTNIGITGTTKAASANLAKARTATVAKACYR